MKNETGVTLLSLMTALAIMAIGFALAAPDLAQMVEKYRFEAQANDFVLSLAMARAEAIQRGQNVTLCPSTNGTTCAAAGNWNRGWIIQDAGANLIKAYPKLTGGISIAASTAGTYDTSITFTPSGRPLSAGDLVLCYNDSANNLNLSAGRTVSVSPAGRPDMSNNADHVGTLTTFFADCDGN